MSKQVVYHGSYCEVKEPKIIVGKYTKDFGAGFYCTILENQAKKWASKYDKSVINKMVNPDRNKYVETTIEVLSSWIILHIDNYNSSMYYENPSYIYACYEEKEILP